MRKRLQPTMSLADRITTNTRLGGSNHYPLPAPSWNHATAALSSSANFWHLDDVGHPWLATVLWFSWHSVVACPPPAGGFAGRRRQRLDHSDASAHPIGRTRAMLRYNQVHHGMPVQRARIADC
jgi:hypothetical protein